MPEFVNPFDEANFASGGGLWDGKTVTIIDSKTEIDLFSNGDGTPWIDPKTGEQGRAHVWTLIGIAEDEDRERKQSYSLGSLVPTADGEGFLKADGTPGVLHKNSAAAKLSKALKDAGFDVSLLFDAKTGKPKVSALRGAKLMFKGEQRLDAKGNPKVNKNGYAVLDFYPTQFLGFKEGVAKPGNGAVTDETRAKAVEMVKTVLGENGNKLTQADLIRKVSAKMAGQSDLPVIVGLIPRPELTTDTGINREGNTLSI